MVIRVVHTKQETSEYIGRPSPLGNPFYMHTESQRSEVVANYRTWILLKIKEKDSAVVGELKRLKKLALAGDMNLGCWCAPRACHGDFIKELIDRSIRRDSQKV